MSINLELKDIKDGEDKYWNVFYIISLDTRTILERVDEDLKKLKERIKFHRKRVANIEVVRAMQWKET